jgi:hypothetical protein
MKLVGFSFGVAPLELSFVVVLLLMHIAELLPRFIVAA